jgi:hypothetical protein
MENYTTKSPVLFLIFNRPDVTAIVFEAIQAAKPPRLYIAADGPRSDKPGDVQLCLETQEVIQNIDWPCEVKTLFREINLGCKNAVSSAIDWFFDNEEEGIILEDDCLPSSDFFYFCDAMLEKYRHDTRIRHITGSNFQDGKKYGDASYFFARQTHVWGWAGWKRVWKDYDKTLSTFDDQESALWIDKIFDDRFIAQDWKKIFSDIKAGKVDTWDYQLALTNYFNHGLSVNPNVNLIKNIGFREDGTHTTSGGSPRANLPQRKIGELNHPLFVLPEYQADYVVFNEAFNLDERWRQHNLLRRRFKRWLKSSLKAI